MKMWPSMRSARWCHIGRSRRWHHREGYKAFVHKKHLTIPAKLLKEVGEHRSVTLWEDPYTTVEEKLLLKFWFLMDHGVSITQGLIQKGVLRPGFDLLGYLKNQPSEECNN